MVQFLQNLQSQLFVGFSQVFINVRKNVRNLRKELWLLRATLFACGLAIVLLIATGYIVLRPISTGLDIIDPDNQLDHSQIELAAQPLIKRNIPLAVVVVSEGSDESIPSSERFDGTHLFYRLENLNPRPRFKAMGLYVSFEPRYSELITGADWQSILDPPTLKHIRLDILNPALRDGHLSVGVAQSLTAIESKLMSVSSIEQWRNDIVRGAWLWGSLAITALVLVANLLSFLRQPRKSLDSVVPSAHSALQRCTENTVHPDIAAGLQARYERLEHRRHQLLHPFFLDREAIAQLEQEYKRFELKLILLIEGIELTKRSFHANLEAVFTKEEALKEVFASQGNIQSQEPNSQEPNSQESVDTSPVKPQTIAALRDRLTQLNQQYQAIASQLPEGEHETLVQQLEELRTQYSHFKATVDSLWRKLYPKVAKAQAKQEKKKTNLFKDLYQHSKSSRPPKSYRSSSSSSSYEDYSYLQDSSGSDINSDGGSW